MKRLAPVDILPFDVTPTIASSRAPRPALPLLLGFVFLGAASLLVPSFLCAQKPVPARRLAAPSSPSQISSPAPAMAELQKRVAAARAARDSGGAEDVARANGRLIALALRVMGKLRLLEGVYAQAIDLYHRSLAFEDVPDTRVDLAIAWLLAGKPDESVAEAQRVTASDPSNARAWNVAGKASMKKQDYSEAAIALSRAIALHPDIEAAYSLGISLLASDQKEKGAAVFRQMIEQAGDSGALHVLFARAYRDAGMLDDSVRELRTAIALDPTTAHAHYFLGLTYLIQNEWVPTPECRREFLLEVRFHPKDYLANYFLGVIGSLAKNFEESDHYLKIASGIDPSAPETWLYLGLNASGRKDTVRAEQLLRKAIALAGDQVSKAHYLIRKGYVVLGRILINSGRTEEGQQLLRRARELQDLSLFESQQHVAGMETERGAGTGGAVAPFIPQQDAEVSRAPSGAGDPTAELDASLLARANLTDAEKRQAVDQEKQVRSILAAGFNDLATSEAIRTQYAAALEHYREAARWDPDFPSLSRNIGIAAFRLGDYPEAIRALSQTLAANPADQQARAMLGLAYFATSAHLEAARTIAPLGDAALRDAALGYAWAASLTGLGELKEATRVLDAVSHAQLSTDTLLLVGKLWTEIGDFSRAVQTFRQALQLDPSLRKAHYYAGLAYIRADNPADGAEEFRAELKLAPDDPDAKYNLGFALLQQSQRDDAVALFRSVLSSHPGHAESHYQLGKILLDQGNVKEAIPHLEEAARLRPETDYIHYQLQAAYRKESRIAEADRELQIYRELKARNRERTIPRPVPKP